MVHAREVAGRVLDFGVSGSLWNDALVMVDRQTGSLWSHVTGECIDGELKGMRLSSIPSLLMPFDEWSRLNPKGRVLAKRPGEAQASRYMEYVASSRQGIFGTRAKRLELEPKAIVQGVALGGTAAAVPRDSLEEGVPVAFELGDRSLVAVKAGGAVLIYDRHLNGKVLDLEPAASESMPLIRDRATGTVWNAVTGFGVSGPLAHDALSAVPSIPAYWFAWLNFYPRARVIH